jgi:hypothetical protein
LDEKKSKRVSLVQQNGFGPTFSHILLKLIQGITKLTPTRENCNKYDLIVIPCLVGQSQ